VDRNNLQVDGQLQDVMNVEPYAEKWRAFGWEVTELDGHDLLSLCAALDARGQTGSRPRVLICRTVKGKGVSFMENVMEWHGSSISREIRNRAIAELEAILQARQGR